MEPQQRQTIIDRVNYYCKLNHPFLLNHDSTTSVKRFKKTGGNTYYFDLRKIIKCFSPELQFSYINGDVITTPDSPCFVKSRPIGEHNAHSVLQKLNAIRHYQFVENDKPFRQKKDMLVWKGNGFWAHREHFINQYYDHPQCDVSRCDFDKASSDSNMATFAPPMSIAKQLDYKFIVSLEGKDVATNLKWIMSSNSVCMMPTPKYETWFMEGKLKAGVHYIEINDDHSNVIEQMNHYLARPKQTQKIIRNAQNWVDQFRSSEQEQLIGLLVAEKYFRLSQPPMLEGSHSLLRRHAI